jgi:Protein of unknown function (DUF3489)
VKAAPKKSEVKTTKQNAILALLPRQNGGSIAETVDATGWQPHSVRGFFADALNKRLAIDVVSEKIDGGLYHVARLKR